MPIITDWKIRASGAQCEHSGEPFEDEQEICTCIFDDPESDGFLRRDYSLESWSDIRDRLDPAPFSFWRSTYKVPVKEEKEEALPPHSVEGMLCRMIEEDDPATENARYILALMLERKKTLIPADVQETETRKLLFYEHKETGEVYVVADPGLRLDEIGRVQKEVSALLAREESGGGEMQEGQNAEGEKEEGNDAAADEDGELGSRG